MKTYEVLIIRSYIPRRVYTDSLARAVLSLIKSSRRNPHLYVELCHSDTQRLLASYNAGCSEGDNTYTWQYDLEQSNWQRYIKHKLETLE